MTLCIAAICGSNAQGSPDRIVFGSDFRAETSWAGGNVAFKFAWLREMGMLMAGEMSKAFDFLETARTFLIEEDHPFVTNKLLETFNDISSAHKEKLCRRYVRQQLGIDFDRFLADGEDELPSDLRARIFHDLAQLDYGCELIFLGFSRSVGRKTGKVRYVPRIIEIDRYGEVSQHQNFAAIGTGAVIAKSTLYQREQQGFHLIEPTLYHVYEAAKLAHRTAPSVGEFEHLVVASVKDDEKGSMRFDQTTDVCFAQLLEIFEEVGPKRVNTWISLDESCFACAFTDDPLDADPNTESKSTV